VIITRFLECPEPAGRLPSENDIVAVGSARCSARVVAVGGIVLPVPSRGRASHQVAGCRLRYVGVACSTSAGAGLYLSIC
jgi:hypothetical protein